MTDYQWSLVSGPRTGTDLHTDPPLAQSWNTLFSGHKVMVMMMMMMVMMVMMMMIMIMMMMPQIWVVLPPDTEHKLLECDPKCSAPDTQR